MRRPACINKGIIVQSIIRKRCINLIYVVNLEQICSKLNIYVNIKICFWAYSRRCWWPLSLRKMNNDRKKWFGNFQQICKEHESALPFSFFHFSKFWANCDKCCAMYSYPHRQIRNLTKEFHFLHHIALEKKISLQRRDIKFGKETLQVLQYS